MRSDRLSVVLRLVLTCLMMLAFAGIYMLVALGARALSYHWAEYLGNYYVVVPVGAAALGISWGSMGESSRAVRRGFRRFGAGLSDLPVGQVICAASGLGFGVGLGFIVSLPFRLILPAFAWAVVAVVMYLTAGCTAAVFGFRRWHDVLRFISRDRRDTKNMRQNLPDNRAMDKVLDTSVIIDGRILDVLATGFVEGVIVIPQFVLAELRHIADSPDPMRRNRGRRGLDILARIQRELSIPVEIDETGAESSEEVDAKLLKLAVARNGAVVTNDFNLNKVASVTGVRVLNLNDLTNALKPALLPGEECTVQIVREGKEPNQGVGFLEDGTMIVVDNARKMIGDRVEAVVTTALQTSAGRMIFARLKFAPVRSFGVEQYSIK